MRIIILNERCTQIICKIIDSDNPLKINELAKMYHVSSRTIRYDLDNIDEFLMANDLPILIRKPNVGIEFCNNLLKKNKALELLGRINPYNYVLSSDERVSIILCNLIQQREFTTINEIAETLKVSRSTVIKDLRKVREWVALNNLEFVSLSKYGIKLVGDEKFIRKAAIKLFSEKVDIYKVLDLVKPYLYSKANAVVDTQIESLFKDIDMPYIKNCVKIAEEQLQTVFSDEAYSGIIIHIAMAIKRIQLSKDITMPKEELKPLEITKEFAVSSNIAKMLEVHFNISIPVDEIGYITIHLLGGNTSIITDNEKENWISLQLLASEIIQNVSIKLDIDLMQDKQLFQGLIEHLRPAIYRLNNGLMLKNPLLNEIKTSYGELFKVVKDSLKPIEKLENKIFSSEEIGYFTLHFGAALERLKGNVVLKPNILVVCATGIGTSKLLSSRIKAIFDVNVIAEVAYHQVKDYICDKKIDLIVSTVPINTKDNNLVIVNPILSDKDINVLNKYIMTFKKSSNVLDDLLGIISKHCTVVNYHELTNDLINYLNLSTYENKRGVVEPVLRELLTKETLELNVEAANWEEAVRKGGHLLEKNDFIQHVYVEAMIDTVKKLGPYIVIAPGIAMPHARPESGVKKIGMSLITLKNPINFGNKENDPVRIVICLCAIDHSTHLKALSELAEFLGDEEFISTTLNAKDVTEIIQYINKNGGKING